MQGFHGCRLLPFRVLSRFNDLISQKHILLQKNACERERITILPACLKILMGKPLSIC